MSEESAHYLYLVQRLDLHKVARAIAAAVAPIFFPGGERYAGFARISSQWLSQRGCGAEAKDAALGTVELIEARVFELGTGPQDYSRAPRALRLREPEAWRWPAGRLAMARAELEQLASPSAAWGSAQRATLAADLRPLFTTADTLTSPTQTDSRFDNWLFVSESLVKTHGLEPVRLAISALVADPETLGSLDPSAFSNAFFGLVHRGQRMAAHKQATRANARARKAKWQAKRKCAG
jgi:hypothetical protein